MQAVLLGLVSLCPGSPPGIFLFFFTRLTMGFETEWLNPWTYSWSRMLFTSMPRLYALRMNLLVTTVNFRPFRCCPSGIPLLSKAILTMLILIVDMGRFVLPKIRPAISGTVYPHSCALTILVSNAALSCVSHPRASSSSIDWCASITT